MQAEERLRNACGLVAFIVASVSLGAALVGFW